MGADIGGDRLVARIDHIEELKTSTYRVISQKPAENFAYEHLLARSRADWPGIVGPMV
jgi:hypothetical protein